jgi:hypothetical protein
VDMKCTSPPSRSGYCRAMLQCLLLQGPAGQVFVGDDRLRKHLQHDKNNQRMDVDASNHKRCNA